MNPGLLTATNNVNADPTKMWYGVVEGTSDPDPALGRVKVRIFGFHTDDRKILPTDDLPWSVLMRPTTTPESTGALKAGNVVCGIFMDGEDCQQPLILGSLFTKLKTLGAELGTPDDYQNIGSAHRIEYTNPQPAQTAESGVVQQSSQQPPNAANPAATGGNVVVAQKKSENEEKSLLKKLEQVFMALGAALQGSEYYNGGGVKLTQDVDKTQATIPVSRTSSLPPRGWFRLGSEELTYEGYNKKNLLNVKRGVKYGTNGGTTNPATHSKGTTVQFFGEAFTRKNPTSKYTGKEIKVAEEIKKAIEVANGYVTGVFNKVKGWLLNLASEIIAKISLFFKSPIPMTLKIICDALMMILKAIACLITNDFINSIVGLIAGGLESLLISMVNEIISKAMSLLDMVQQCLQSVFDAVTSLVTAITSITSMISQVASMFGNIGNISNITSVASIISLLANLLGMFLCNKPKENPNQYYKMNNGMTPSGCEDKPPAKVYDKTQLDCLDQFDVANLVLGSLSAPVTALNTILDYGGGIIHQFDSTPDFIRSHMELGNGNALVATKEGIRITTAGSKEEVIIQNGVVKVRGNYIVDVDGDISFNSGGNFTINCKDFSVVNRGLQRHESLGEAELLYKDSVHIKPINQYLVTGAKVGLTASGGVEFAGGHLTSLVSEINWASLGSTNSLSIFKNGITGLKTKVVAAADSALVGGAKTDTVAGVRGNQTGAAESNTTGAVTNNTVGAAEINNAGAARVNTSSTQADTTGAATKQTAAKNEVNGARCVTTAAQCEAAACRAKAAAIHIQG